MAVGVRDEVGYIEPIEGLRGVAVLWVVAFHYVVVRTAGFPADPWLQLVAASPAAQVILRNGYLGVDLFFLITGFLLTLPWLRYAERQLPAPPAREFYRRRAHRILPAYYVQLLFLFLICIPLLRDLTYWKSDLAYYLLNFAAHVTMVHYTTPLTSSSVAINGALWTLALEAQYYLLLPLLAPLVVRAPRVTAAALLAAAVAWRWLAQYDMTPLVDFQMALSVTWSLPESKIRHLLGTQLPAYLGHFAAGILAGRAWLRWRERRPGRFESAAWLGAAAACLFVLYRMHAPGGVWLGDFNWVLIPISMGILMLALVSSGVAAARPLLANAPLKFAGRISYSIYLYHLPLLLLWNKFAPRELGWLSLPLYLGVVVAVAWASRTWVELPNMSAPSRTRPHRQRCNDGERLQ
ncbi:MAG: acyltransferase [Pseudomonadota bacterium]|nr:acyltransferase [Pseudomonadota bacterium]